MKLSERIDKKFGTSEAIPGFKVMEWLRGVRDEHYRLSVEDPKAYKEMREKGKRKLREMAKKEVTETIKSSQLLRSLSYCSEIFL